MQTVKTVLFLGMLLISQACLAQGYIPNLNINTLTVGSPSSANSTALLDAQSTTRGVLLPRMTTVQQNAISSPAEGLALYDLTKHQPAFFNGTSWLNVFDAGSINTGTLNSSRLPFPLLLADGIISAPAYSFTNEATSGLYRVGANNVGLAINNGLAFDCRYVSANNYSCGLGTASDATGHDVLNAGATINSYASYNFDNLSTGAGSLTLFQILNGSSNPLVFENHNYTTTPTYLAGGALISASGFLSGLNLMAENSGAYIAFNTSGRTLATERMRLTNAALTLNIGTDLVLSGSTSGATTINAGPTGTYNFNLPIAAGSSGQPLLSAGGGSSAMTFGTLGAAAGGTGQTTYTDGQVLIGTTSSGGLTKASLTAGSNITITPGSGSITIAATSSASAAWNYVAKTTTYNPASINDYISASSASFTITLPTAVGVAGQSIAVKHNGLGDFSQKYTLNTTSGQTISDPSGTVTSGNYVLWSRGEVVVLTSDNANWQVTSHYARTQPIPYTAAFAGFGTVVTQSFFFSRRGDVVVISGYFVTATAAASLGSMTLPTNLSINTTELPIPANSTAAIGYNVGSYQTSNTNGLNGRMITAPATDATKIYFGNSIASGSDPLLVSTSVSGSVSSSGNTNSIYLEVPISGFQP